MKLQISQNLQLRSLISRDSARLTSSPRSASRASSEPEELQPEVVPQVNRKWGSGQHGALVTKRRICEKSGEETGNNFTQW